MAMVLSTSAWFCQPLEWVSGDYKMVILLTWGPMGDKMCAEMVRP